MARELTEEELDAAFAEAAEEADEDLAADSEFGDDLPGEPSPAPQPEDDEDDDQEPERVQAPPRPAAAQPPVASDAPAWIQAIGDEATREQALSDWKRLSHAEASQRGRAASLNRKWAEAQDLIKQREVERAAGASTAATDDSLSALGDDYPQLSEALEKALAARDRQWEEKLSRYAEPLEAVRQQRHQQEALEQGSLVAEKHPDWAEVAGRDDFADWVQESPHRMGMFQADDAASTIELLDLYKLQHGLIHQSPQSSQAPQRVRRRSQLSDLASLPKGGASRLQLTDADDEDAIFAAAAKLADAELRRF